MISCACLFTPGGMLIFSKTLIFEWFSFDYLHYCAQKCFAIHLMGKSMSCKRAHSTSSLSDTDTSSVKSHRDRQRKSKSYSVIWIRLGRKSYAMPGILIWATMLLGLRCAKWSPNFYPRPVMTFRYCHCIFLCLYVWVSIMSVCAITHHPFKLEPPNLDKNL